MRAFLRELSDFVRFFRTRETARNLVVYSEDRSYTSFFEGLIQCLRNEHQIPLCYVTSDPGDPMLSGGDPGIARFYIRHLLSVFMILLDCKLVLMTMPDLQRLHIKRSMRGARHVYLFHNIGSYFHVIREGGLLHYDVVFTVGPHHERELRREEELFAISARELVPFGYYRLDRIIEESRRRGVHPSHGREKRRVFLAPGWGPWHERNSMLDLCGREIIASLTSAGFEVVFRPHPMTRIKYPDSLDSLYREFDATTAFRVNEDISDLTPYYDCDVMVSDWSGVVYEFAFGVEKPVVFVDSPMKVNNPRYKEFGFPPIDCEIRAELGVVMPIGQAANAASAVAEALARKDHFSANIVRLRRELVHNVGCSSQAGARWIVHSLSHPEEVAGPGHRSTC
jgi:YidC/Oxa1 family membrane protein insertase